MFDDDEGDSGLISSTIARFSPLQSPDTSRAGFESLQNLSWVQTFLKKIVQ